MVSRGDIQLHVNCKQQSGTWHSPHSLSWGQREHDEISIENMASH